MTYCVALRIVSIAVAGILALAPGSATAESGGSGLQVCTWPSGKEDLRVVVLSDGSNGNMEAFESSGRIETVEMTRTPSGTQVVVAGERVFRIRPDGTLTVLSDQALVRGQCVSIGWPWAARLFGRSQKEIRIEELRADLAAARAEIAALEKALRGRGDPQARLAALLQDKDAAETAAERREVALQKARELLSEKEQLAVDRAREGA